MSSKMIEAPVISQECLCDGIYDMWLDAGTIAAEAKPGQFISVYSRDKSRLLPRPISICEADARLGRLRIVYRIAGAGTEVFSKLGQGDRLRIMGPLGNGFKLRNEKAVLIAGGIGIPPMLELAKRLNAEKTIVVGYRDANTFLCDALAKYGRVVIATEDGSAGVRGNVIDAMEAEHVSGGVIYGCGPTPMLRALKAYAAEKGIACQISLEERMACGIGACLACVCRSAKKDHHTNVHNKRICKDGPVFDAEEIEL